MVTTFDYYQQAFAKFKKKLFSLHPNAYGVWNQLPSMTRSLFKALDLPDALSAYTQP